MTNVRFDHHSGSFAWRASDWGDPATYGVVLDDADRAELVEAAVAWRRGAGLATDLRDGDAIARIGREHAPLPRLAARLAEAAREVRDGRGFVLLRGLPDDASVDLDTFTTAVLAVGLHFGRPLSQNAGGERVTYVEDATATDPTPRMYRSNLELRPHTDPTAMISLATWQRARSGGASVIASAVTVHDEMRRRAPHLLERLYRGYHYHRLGEESEGEAPVTEWRVPVFANVDGELSARYLRTGIVAGERALGRELEPEDIEALDLFDRLSTAPEHRLAFFLERGDMIVLNNYTVMHARTRFVNDPTPGRERRLVRLWLDAPGFRRVPREIHLFRENGVPRAAGRRANFDFKKLYANDPVATGGVADLKVTDAMAARTNDATTSGGS